MSRYCIQEMVLAQGEQSLYRALTLVVAQRALVLSKVKLSALLAPAVDARTGGVHTYLDRYTVDFVLCDPQTTRPLLIILQDASNRDQCVVANNHDTVARHAAEAGLPVVRLGDTGAYRMDQLLRLLEPYLQQERSPNETLPTQPRTITIPRPATLFSRN